MDDREARLKALMVRGLAGDTRSHASLLTELSAFLRGYFRARLGAASADAEDLVQEALLAIHLKRATFDPALAFTPWAFAIARYKLVDHWRRRGLRQALPLEAAGELLAHEDVEEGAVRRDVARLLSSLPPRQAAVLRDVKITGLSMEAAAARHGLSVTAAKVTVHRALKRLARKVADEDL